MSGLAVGTKNGFVSFAPAGRGWWAGGEGHVPALDPEQPLGAEGRRVALRAHAERGGAGHLQQTSRPAEPLGRPSPRARLRFHLHRKLSMGQPKGDQPEGHEVAVFPPGVSVPRSLQLRCKSRSALSWLESQVWMRGVGERVLLEWDRLVNSCDDR